MKSELYSPLKPDLSKKGLSQIMEQSYKDQLENSKYELAKLSNQQFLSQYIRLNNNNDILNEYKNLLETPSCEAFKKFDFSDGQRQLNFRKQIKHSIQNGVKMAINYYSKEQLKALASKKLEQAAEKERLSTSRKQKRDSFYESLKNSRKNEETRDVKTTGRQILSTSRRQQKQQSEILYSSLRSSRKNQESRVDKHEYKDKMFLLSQFRTSQVRQRYMK